MTCSLQGDRDDPLHGLGERDNHLHGLEEHDDLLLGLGEHPVRIILMSALLESTVTDPSGLQTTRDPSLSIFLMHKTGLELLFSMC